MGRLVVLIVLAVIAVWLLRRAFLPSSERQPRPGRPSLEGELVRCAHCGLHLPRTDARSVAGREYCSEEHARLGPGKG